MIANPTPIPEIVRIVLSHAEVDLRSGEISRDDFERKLARVRVEELDPRGMTLVVRELSDGGTRFLIKDAHSGKVRDLVECTPPVAAA